MGSIKVTFVQVDGVEKKIADAEPGESLMELAKANGVEGILGDCGGGCACATCHVYVDPQWHGCRRCARRNRGDDPGHGVGYTHEQQSALLPDQVRPELDGLRVTVAPSE